MSSAPQVTCDAPMEHMKHPTTAEFETKRLDA